MYRTLYTLLRRTDIFAVSISFSCAVLIILQEIALASIENTVPNSGGAEQYLAERLGHQNKLLNTNVNFPRLRTTFRNLRR